MDLKELPEQKLAMTRTEVAQFLVKDVIKADGQCHHPGF